MSDCKHKIAEMSSEKFIGHLFQCVLGGFYADSEINARYAIIDMIEDKDAFIEEMLNQKKAKDKVIEVARKLDSIFPNYKPELKGWVSEYVAIRKEITEALKALGELERGVAEQEPKGGGR